MTLQEILKRALDITDFEPSIEIIEAGFSLEAHEPEETFPFGYSLVYRNCDGEVIGRVEPDDADPSQWKARSWAFGGGTTFGGFKTAWVAAFWLLARNSGLGEDWND